MVWNKGFRRGTLYQQKWTAKAETRAYHGEKLTETQFRNHFTGRLNAVAPLKSAAERENQEVTPFALQTYAALEKRLDIALFRAMFASSPRQAAQFIKYGKVKVNGITIKHPGYTLKAGDVFSCDPERVLQATGRSKPSLKQSVEFVNRQISRYNRYVKKAKKNPERMFKIRERHRARHPWLFEKERKNVESRISRTNSEILESMNKNINAVTPSVILKNILLKENVFDKNGSLPDFGFGKDVQSKSISVFQLVTGKRAILTPVEKESSNENENVKTSETNVENDEAKETQTEVVSSQTTESGETSESVVASETDTSAIEVDEASIDKTVSEYLPERKYDAAGKPVAATNPPQHASDVKKLLLEIVKVRQEQIQVESKAKLLDPSDPASYKRPYDPKWAEKLQEVPLVDAEAAEADPQSVLPIRLPWLSGGHYGLQEPEKPYFTPWAPRPYLAPFAILPHHIEISFETCHAIYMRDPIARPGHSEVISPFSLDMHERAYMFYVTRRRK